jgi:hypothetical protein
MKYITLAIGCVLVCYTLIAQANFSDYETLQSRACSLGITVKASRDTGPVTRMDASGLIVSIDIFTQDRSQLSDRVSLIFAWALSGKQLWNLHASKSRSVSRYFDGTGMAFQFREGPSWPFDSGINIIILLDINDRFCEFVLPDVQIIKNK